MNKIIQSPQYHVWSDALHLRQLARETPNRWDQATYIRASVMLAWAAFEAILTELLNAKRLGGKFQDNLNQAIEANGLRPLDWGRGTWQAVAQLNQVRVDYVHRTTVSDLLPELHVADGALRAIRDAVADVCLSTRTNVPAWISDDVDRGWSGASKSRSRAHGTAIHEGADPSDPTTLRVVIEDDTGEHVTAYHPPHADPKAIGEARLIGLNVPVSAIRVYRGDRIEFELLLRMRGGPA